MKIGTRSLLFGAHQFLIHPVFVAWAWVRLYGWSFHPLLWLAFVIHDWGYFGKSNMDGEEGERHVEWGARVLGWLGGPGWRDFALCHSRFYARTHGTEISRLCVADKLAIALTPAWLYLPMVRLTGEIKEYIHAVKHHEDTGDFTKQPNAQREWFNKLQTAMRSFAFREQWFAELNDVELRRGPMPKVWI